MWPEQALLVRGDERVMALACADDPLDFNDSLPPQSPAGSPSRPRLLPLPRRCCRRYRSRQQQGTGGKQAHRGTGSFGFT